MLEKLRDRLRDFSLYIREVFQAVKKTEVAALATPFLVVAIFAFGSSILQLPEELRKSAFFNDLIRLIRKIPNAGPNIIAAPPPPPPAAQTPVEIAPCQLAPGHNCLVKVFFGTDRKPNSSPVIANYFGGERNDTEDPLTFGTVLVSIPAEHKVGHLEKPLPFFSADPRNDLVVLDLKVSSEAGFVSSLSDAVRESRDKEALIFIHGYFTKFDEAARRTAQLAWDLQFQGVPILYSWPSRGDPLYTADEASALWAVPHLKRFLQFVVQRSGAKTIHVVAHSLGNRSLMYALQQISQDHSSTVKFKQIVLAAPDIDAGIFRQLASAFPSTAERVTIYASSHDRALALSKLLHQSPSMGRQPQSTHALGTGVDLIDASVMSDDLFSFDHSYYAGNVEVLEDMSYVIRAGLPPEKRLLLDPHPSSGMPLYWTFRP